MPVKDRVRVEGPFVQLRVDASHWL
jgi:hypothetical protein